MGFTMKDKHDYKAALVCYNEAQDNFDMNVWLNSYTETFLSALRIADRLQSGKVSAKAAGYKPSESEYHAYERAVQDITAQMIKGAEGDE